MQYELCADTTVTSGPVVPPITVTITPITEPPAPVCGALPVLTSAAWSATDDGLLWHQCEEGFSFNDFLKMEDCREVVECIEGGMFSPVHACLPIDYCQCHVCGAFSTCVDLHMDWTTHAGASRDTRSTQLMQCVAMSMIAMECSVVRQELAWTRHEFALRSHVHMDHCGSFHFLVNKQHEICRHVVA